jgi:hypothetical protein
MNRYARAAFGMVCVVGLAACGSARTASVVNTAPSASTASAYTKPGFVTEVRDGRLWVFRENSAELQEFKSQGELGKSVTRVGGGPNGMTIRAADAQTLDDYLGSK